MNVFYTAGRLALSWLFLRAGVDVVQRPERPAATAGPMLAAARSRLPVTMPADVVVVRANAAVQLVAASVMAAGKAPRLAASVLIGSLLPTTVAGHRFWEFDDPAQRINHRNHFNKNLAVVGGLLLVVGRKPV